MTHQRTPLEMSRTVDETASEPTRLDSRDTPRQLPAPEAAPKTGSSWTIAEPRPRVGMIITCLLGALPIIALALVRWHGQEPDDREASEALQITETRGTSAQANDSLTPARVVPTVPIAERDPDAIDTSLEPREPPPPLAQLSPTKSRSAPARATPPSGAHSLASKPTHAAQSDVANHTVTPCPAPVQSAWFEYR